MEGQTILLQLLAELAMLLRLDQSRTSCPYPIAIWLPPLALTNVVALCCNVHLTVI